MSHRQPAAAWPPGLQPPGGWLAPPQRLLAPPQRQRGAVFRALSLLARRFGRAEVPDIFAVLHLNRRLFWPWLLFASRLMPGGRLAAAERETLILRTAWNCRSLYEWGQHVEIALAAGVDDAAILRVAQGPEACADGHERALLQACDELCRERGLSDATWAALARRYDSRLMIEIVVLVGHYIMIAGFLNSAGLKLEAPVAQVLAAFEARAADGAMRPDQG